MTALAVDTTVFHQLLVELLQIMGSQLGELDIADAGNRVLLDHQMVAVCRGNSYVWLGVNVVPASQPCGDGILIGTADVNTLDRFQSGTQFCLAFCLRLSQHIFDDPLSCFRVVACCVATLPTPVCAFANVAFAICTFFAMSIAPFFGSHNTDHTLRRKATDSSKEIEIFFKMLLLVGTK